MHKTIFLLLSLLLPLFPSWGQSISGQIVDEKNTPIEYASIIGVSPLDTTKTIVSAFSKEGGYFVLDCSLHKNDTLRLKISCAGYKTFHTVVAANHTFEKPIALEESVIGLNEIVVSAYKQAITLADGKIGIDTEKLRLGNNDNVLDVLKRAPGVVVSHDAITVQGNEPLVVIDGVKQRMPMGILLTYLKSMPAANLKRLFIKSMATAENRLSGEDATIELQTKKMQTRGYNISNTIHGTLLRNNAFRWGDYIDIRARHGNLSGSATAGYVKSKLKSEEEERFPYEQHEKLINQKATRDKDAYFGVLNMSWMPSFLKGSLNYFVSYYVDDSRRKGKEAYNTDAVLDKLTEREINDWTNLLSTNIEYLSADTLKHQFKISYGLLAGSDDYAQTVNNSLGNSVNTNKTMDGHRHIIEAQYTLKRPKFVYTVGNQNYISKMNENVKSKNGSDFSM